MTTKVERELRIEFDRLRTLLTEAATAREVADNKVTRIVTECRATGMPWSDIGLALGMSRQAAWERYKNVENPDHWDWDAHKSGPENHMDTCSRDDCTRPAKWHVVWIAGCCHVCGIHRRQIESTGLGVRSIPLEG